MIDIKREIGSDNYTELTINQRITHIREAIRTFVSNLDLSYSGIPTTFAIEIPILPWGSGADSGRGFKNKSIIDQSRLTQSIVELSMRWNMYNENSEINVSTGKSAIIKGGQQMKKWRLHDILREQHNVRVLIEKPKKHVEAVMDAVGVGLGFIKLTKKS